MVDKYKMYQNKVNKNMHNNMQVYMSCCKDNIKHSWNISDIKRKINDIVNADNFIYTKKVNILVGNDLISRKIVGVFNNNLVTIDNEYIPIENIKDIYN